MKLLILNSSHFSRADGGQSTFIKNMHIELANQADLYYLHLPEYCFKQNLIPIRLMYFIEVLFFFIFNRHNQFKYIISHSPESSFVASFFATPFCHIFHGNNNPVKKSKFWYGKYFSKVFDYFEIRIIKKAKNCYTVGEPRSDARQIMIPILPLQNNVPCENRKGIFFVGRLESVKNVERIIDIYAGLPANIQNENKLHIIGFGTHENLLKRITTIKKLNKHVKFYGRLSNEDTLEKIKSFKVLLMASSFEGFPMVIGESLVLSIPVVSTNVGSLSNVITDGYNGFCLPINADNRLFEDAVLTILQNYNKFSQNATNSSSIFSPSNLCNQILKDI